jgi:hypothetical protein
MMATETVDHDKDTSFAEAEQWAAAAAAAGWAESRPDHGNWTQQSDGRVQVLRHYQATLAGRPVTLRVKTWRLPPGGWNGAGAEGGKVGLMLRVRDGQRPAQGDPP